MAKVKLKKKKSASQQPNESPREFALNNIDIVQDTDVLGGDEEEVTTINNMRLLRSGLVMDARSYRSALMRLEDNAGGFNNLDEDIQEELARTFATNPVNVVTKFPDFWERVRNGHDDFHKKQVEARAERFRWCASVIYNACTSTAAAFIIGKMIQKGFWTLYVEFGVESQAEDGIESLFDYVNSTAGTSYEGAGLLEDGQGNMNAGTITNIEMVLRIDECLRLGKFYKLNE
jgi:hypothetical protein